MNILFISPYATLPTPSSVQGKPIPTPSTIVAIINPNAGSSYILHKLVNGVYVPFTTGDDPNSNNIYYEILPGTFEKYNGPIPFTKQTNSVAMNLMDDFGGKKHKNGKKSNTKSKKNKKSKTSKTSKKNKTSKKTFDKMKK